MILTKPVYIADIIGMVVSLVQTEVLATIQANETVALGATSIQAIDFQYGHRVELIQTLAQKDSDPQQRFLKYPLVYLVQDFRERRGREVGVYAEVSLNIIIAHQTESTDKITDRMAKVFKPVLYPIYYSLIKQLATIPQTLEGYQDQISHDKWDRSYWGTQAVSSNTANVLNDYVDAIDIQNLDLKINYQPCLTLSGNKS
jgi:hypothetical protein